MVSALINPFSKSEWISPAAFGAVDSFVIVQALVSSGPDVKKVCNDKSSYPYFINKLSPVSDILIIFI